jgi:hypothetical protein
MRALAAVPRIVGSPVVLNPSFHGVANTMMYTVTVEVTGHADDADHVAVVGYTDDYTTCAGSQWTDAPAQTFDTTSTRTWTLYNFQPGTTYYYRVRVGPLRGATRLRCGKLETALAPTPTLPTNLGYLNLQFDKAGAADPVQSKYVLMESDDCGATPASAAGARDYVFVVDPERETIVWYLDLKAMTGLVGGASGSGSRYQPGTTETSGRILMVINKRYLYEWSFDGTQVGYADFAAEHQCSGMTDAEGPCIHHDAYKSDLTDRTYVLSTKLSSANARWTQWSRACGSSARFVDDGFQVLDRSYARVGEYSLMRDYDFNPQKDGGPNAEDLASGAGACEAVTWSAYFDPDVGSIDWTHVDSISGSSFGGTEVLDLSVKEWDQVIRIDAATGERLWTLSSHREDSDWGRLVLGPGLLGDADFGDQHDAHAVGEDAMMLVDNQGDRAAGSRVLRLALTDTGRSRRTTIDRVWMFVDAEGTALYCPVEGSGQEVPGTFGESVLGACNDEYTIMELSDGTGGTGEPPPLTISLPDGTKEPFCTSGGPASRSNIRGWHKAYALENVGAF